MFGSSYELHNLEAQVWFQPGSRLSYDHVVCTATVFHSLAISRRQWEIANHRLPRLLPITIHAPQCSMPHTIATTGGMGWKTYCPNSHVSYSRVNHCPEGQVVCMFCSITGGVIPHAAAVTTRTGDSEVCHYKKPMT